MKYSKNLYEINKELMTQINTIDPILFNQKCKQITEDIWKRKATSKYWMLLCREKNDYTIFHLENSSSDFYDALIECLNNRGKVLDITKQPDNNYEIWIRDIETKDNFIYYLFDYSMGVITI